MANTGKSEMTPLERKEYDELVGRVAAMSPAQRDLTMLSAIEASVLLKISIGTLDRARSKRRDLEQAGEPIAPTSHASIPFARSGDEGPVQYFAQDIVDFLARLRFASRLVNVSREPASVSVKLEGIRCWMAMGSAEETWPFAIQRDGRPVDMMDALSHGLLTGEARRLTLREFAKQMADASAAQFASSEKADLRSESEAVSRDARMAGDSRRSMDGAL